MKAILNIVRGLLAFIILVIFLTLLTITPVLLSISTLVTNRESISNWLNTSGVYSQISDMAVDRVLDELKDTKIPSKEMKVIEAKITKAISPQFVQESATTLLNGIYDWLEGKTESISIKPTEIDIQGVIKELIPKEQLKDQQFMQLLNSLKPCTEAQAEKYEKLGGFKSVEDFCLPPSLDLVKVAGQSYDDNVGNQVIKTDNIFQIPDIPQENSAIIKAVYTSLTYAELILFSTLFILLVLFIVIAPSRFFKVYAIGALIFFASLVQLFIWKSAQLLTYASDFFLQNIPMEDLEIDTEIISNVTSVVLGDIAKLASNYSLWILLFSIVMLITTGVIHYFVNKKTKDVPTPTTTPEKKIEEDKPAEPIDPKEVEKRKPVVGSEPPKKK